MMTPFRDRSDAGRKLAKRLIKYRFGDSSEDVIVLGLPRGGVPVAAEVAQALTRPLDVFVVRKIGAPMHPELAIGAIASGGVMVKNEDVIRDLKVDRGMFGYLVAREKDELQRRERLYRGDRSPLDLAGKTVIIVDDGIATGASMQAAALAVRAHRPGAIVIATPVAAANVPRAFASSADEFVSVYLPDDFSAVGYWYEDFSQTTDDEVTELLQSTAMPLPPDTGDTGHSTNVS
jgi:putative phosphoribosyl transferase